MSPRSPIEVGAIGVPASRVIVRLRSIEEEQRDKASGGADCSRPDSWEHHSVSVEIFKYGQIEIDHLKGRDKKLGAAIETIGAIRREIRPDPFEALVTGIVAQQISSRVGQRHTRETPYAAQGDHA